MSREIGRLSDSERLERLRAQDWETIILRLTAYAVYKIQRLSWQTGKQDLPGGRQPKDLAFDAIKLVWTGERACNPIKQSDLLKHLKSIVDSLVSHLIRSAEHMQRERVEGEVDGVALVFDPVDEEASNALDEVVAADIFERLWQRAKGDEDLELVLCCIEEGMSRPSDISDAVKMEVERVYKAKKKLGIILRTIQEE
jgi:hypothetical protein